MTMRIGATDVLSSRWIGPMPSPAPSPSHHPPPHAIVQRFTTQPIESGPVVCLTGSVPRGSPWKVPYTTLTRSPHSALIPFPGAAR